MQWRFRRLRMAGALNAGGRRGQRGTEGTPPPKAKANSHGQPSVSPWSPWSHAWFPMTVIPLSPIPCSRQSNSTLASWRDWVFFVGVQPLGWHWRYSFVAPASAGHSRPPEGKTANPYEEQPKGCTPTGTASAAPDLNFPLCLEDLSSHPSAIQFWQSLLTRLTRLQKRKDTGSINPFYCRWKCLSF